MGKSHGRPEGRPYAVPRDGAAALARASQRRHSARWHALHMRTHAVHMARWFRYATSPTAFTASSSPARPGLRIRTQESSQSA